jgi:hypothetical protein
MIIVRTEWIRLEFSRLNMITDNNLLSSELWLNMSSNERSNVEKLVNGLCYLDDDGKDFDGLISTLQKLAKFLKVPVHRLIEKGSIGFRENKTFNNLPFMVY